EATPACFRLSSYTASRLDTADMDTVWPQHSGTTQLEVWFCCSRYAYFLLHCELLQAVFARKGFTRITPDIFAFQICAVSAFTRINKLVNKFNFDVQKMGKHLNMIENGICVLCIEGIYRLNKRVISTIHPINDENYFSCLTNVDKFNNQHFRNGSIKGGRGVSKMMSNNELYRVSVDDYSLIRILPKNFAFRYVEEINSSGKTRLESSPEGLLFVRSCQLGAHRICLKLCASSPLR
ncbi:hypothetical protein LSTR_LSTR004286, partial [Laodelphax striatellus]